MNILIAGDFCPQKRVARLFDKREYEIVLGDVKPIIEEADYSIVNYECPVTLGAEKPILKCGPNLFSSEKGLEAAKWAGFDCVTLANNHFLDYGKEGAENTINTCRTIGLDKVGGGLNLCEASQILYKELCGSKIGIINCCEHEFSIATETTAGSNPLNPVQQFYAITEARKNAECVLVIVHGGHEHFQLPSPRMQELYRFFIDAGADAVVNHHQHCYSGYELYKDKPIVYGLGNFCFDWPEVKNGIWNKGYMVIISFEKVINTKFVPYDQCSETPAVKVILDKTEFERNIKELNDFISNKNKLTDADNKYYQSCQNQYSYIFEPIRHRVFYALKSRGWLPSFITTKRKLVAADFVGCESHRDKLLFYLYGNK